MSFIFTPFRFRANQETSAGRRDRSPVEFLLVSLISFARRSIGAGPYFRAGRPAGHSAYVIARGEASDFRSSYENSRAKAYFSATERNCMAVGAVTISNSGIEHGTWLSALPDQLADNRQLHVYVCATQVS